MNDVLARLISEGLLDAEKARQVTEAAAAGKPLDDALRAVNGVSEEKILRSLAAYFDVPFIDLEKEGGKYAPSKEFLAKFPARILLDRRIMPLAPNGDGVAIVTSRIFDNGGLDELRLATGLDVHPVIAPSAEIDRFIKKYLGVGADTLQSMRLEENADDDVKVLEEQGEDDLDLSTAAHDASIIKFVNQVMAEALDLRATDVHVEPLNTSFACAIASTACCRRRTFRIRFANITRRSCRASKFSAIWTSRKSVCRRTAGFD